MRRPAPAQAPCSPTAYGLQTAGLDLTTVSSTGFITGLYVVLTPMIALVLFRTPVAPPRGSGSRSRVAGLLMLNGVPGGSALGNALVLGNAVAQSFQIVAWSGSRRDTTPGR